MSRARNAVIILILCIIGGYSVMKKSGPALMMPEAVEELRDTVRNNPTRASRPGLNFGQTNDGELRDAVANNAAENGGGTQFGNSEGGNPPPPRGSGNGGFGPLGNGGPGQNLPPIDPPELSPSTPPSEPDSYCLNINQECSPR